MALLIGLGIGRTGLLRAEGITVATTAVFVITSAGAADSPVMLGERMLDTAIGVAVGALINLIVVPPLTNRSAQRYIDDINRQLGGLMVSMATQLRSDEEEERAKSWIDRTREIDRDLDSAWRVVRSAEESARFNPRYRFSRRVTDPAKFRTVLLRLEEGVAEIRSIARIVDESARAGQDWNASFRERWLDLLTETGNRIADPDAGLETLHHDLTQHRQRRR